MSSAVFPRELAIALAVVLFLLGAVDAVAAGGASVAGLVALILATGGIVLVLRWIVPPAPEVVWPAPDWAAAAAFAGGYAANLMARTGGAPAPGVAGALVEAAELASHASVPAILLLLALRGVPAARSFHSALVVLRRRAA